MTLKSTTNFRDFYNDQNNVSPGDRAKIEFEVDLIGKLIEARETKGFTQAQLDKLTIVPNEESAIQNRD